MLAWRSVAMPDTQKMVLMISLNASVLFVIHSGPDRMIGTATVDPNIVMYCYVINIEIQTI